MYGEYWICPNDQDIRPYGILIRECDPEELEESEE